MNYRDTWDMSTVPDTVLASEMGRRAAARRSAPATPKVMRPCKKCGKLFGARELRKHLPRCSARTPLMV